MPRQKKPANDGAAKTKASAKPEAKQKPAKAAAPVVDIEQMVAENFSEAPGDRWPFGVDRGPIVGYIRSLFPKEVRPFEDFGNGYVIYHRVFSDTAPPAYVQPDDDGGWTCSVEGHQAIPYGCADIWEHRFRFGDLKDGEWKAPIRAVRVNAKKSKIPYEQVERYLPRPNPVVDGLKTATLMKHARVNMPTDSQALLARCVRQIRRERNSADQKAGVKRGRGQPQADIFDIALVAVDRIHQKHTYERLDAEIHRLCHTADAEGLLIASGFKYPRVDEAMNGRKSSGNDPNVSIIAVEKRLSNVLEEMRDRMAFFLRRFTTVAHLDGAIYSTARTDNACRQSYARGRHKVHLHVMYDHRWGIITSFNVTWNCRGRGSAEAPQFPRLMTETKRLFPDVRMVAGDGSYGSDRNHAYALERGVQLISLLSDDQWSGGAKYLSDDQVKIVKSLNTLESPVFRQLSPFRNRAEGGHSTVRQVTGSYCVSRPDLLHYPASTAKDLKATPNAAEATLPEDQAERDAIIDCEQWVGRAVYNEFLCRQIVSMVRALCKCQRYYKRPVDFAFPFSYEPRPQDEAWSVWRPRLEGVAPQQAA